MTTADQGSTVFKTRGPLDPVADAAICVRRPELEPLLHIAQSPTVDAYLAILGSPQTGKTTLLHQLRDRLQRRGYGIVLIDLSGIHGPSEADWYRYVAGKINADLALASSPLRKRRNSSAPCNPIQFRQFLFDTARQSKAPRIVIMLDHIQAVPDKIANPFYRTIQNVFHIRRQENGAAFEKFLFVFSGGKELSDLSTSPDSLLPLIERVYLQDLSLENVTAIASNFSQTAIFAPSATAQWIYDQTRGHPYLTQKLCAQIEQWHPGVITQEIVTRATVQMLKSDDHFENISRQIDADPAASQLLEDVVKGQSVPFNRQQPAVASLEMIGAIRDAGQCALRNPIYFAAFRSHFKLAPALEQAPPRKLGPRLAIVAAMLLLILFNLPLLFNYSADILFATRVVSDQFLAVRTQGSNFTIHYDRVLVPNGASHSEITVDMDGLPANGPINVIFQPEVTEIALDGSGRRTMDQPFQQISFPFRFNQSILGTIGYNPFSPGTEHRRVTLSFELQTDSTRRDAYDADFVIDHNSAFIIGVAVCIVAFFVALGAIFIDPRHIDRIWSLIRQFRDKLG